ERLDRNAAGFKQFFTVPNRVERRWTRTQCANASIFQLPNNVAGPDESPQVRPELRTIRVHGMHAGQRITQAVLFQIIADRHFAAEAVASVPNRHLLAFVIERMNEHWNVKVGPTQRVSYCAFISEIGQCHQYSAYLVTMSFEQIGAFLRIVERLDRSKLG